MHPTQEYVRNLLDYEPDIGILRWKIGRHGPKARAGAIAGWANGAGYTCITLSGRAFQLHQVIWLWMTGEWPDAQIDHKNRVRNDNRWCNLRLATASQNKANSQVCTSKSGFRGVDFQKGKWRTRIKVKGSSITIGLFHSPEAAHAAYLKATSAYFAEYAPK